MIANDDELIVEDAHRDPLWKDNVDLKHDMSFYMGYPLRWPDGALLGTLCVLDRSTNQQALHCRELLPEFRGHIESDLALLAEVSRRERAELELRELMSGLEWPSPRWMRTGPASRRYLTTRASRPVSG